MADTINNLLRNSTVYVYHVPDLDAIKVGFGDNSHVRMAHYCKNHELIADSSSIRSWKIPAVSIASALESAIHKGLKDAGFSKIDYVSQNGRAIELFSLNGGAYNDAVLYVTDLLDAITGKLVDQLGGSRVDAERRHQAEQRTRQTKARLHEQRAEQERLRLAEFTDEWEKGWDEFIRPWCELSSRYKNLRQNYKPPGMLYKLTHGDDLIPHFVKWHGYGELLYILSLYFCASRKARVFRNLNP
jgi:hypothetical protein